MKKIVICDDVEIDRSILRHFLEKYFDDRGEEALVEEYSSGESLTADVEEGYLGMDLLFLDIFMNGINGMETAVKLRALSRTAPIVFLTMSPDFAVESYEVEASGYILKPFSASQLVRLLEKTLKTGDRNRVAVKTGRQFRYPYTDDILYIDSNRHIVTLHLKDGSEIVTQDKLNDIESRIGEKRFLRCHQSYLVNMDQVADVKEDFILKNGNMVPIRVRGRKELIDAYNRYFLSRKEGDFAE